MSDSHTPWVEVKRSSHKTDVQQEASNTDQKNIWQAMFACYINILPFKEREKFKWGFSAAFLLEEALDRQKLFLQSQFLNNPIDEQREYRTLALRCICVPKVGLQLGLVAKILAESPEKACMYAQNYCSELESTFPYDYTIQPALSEEEFCNLTGRDILSKCRSFNSLAQVRRFESPVRTSSGVFRMLGIWQTDLRGGEQIWRALANYPQELLLNISIQPTILFEGERRALLKMKNMAQLPDDTPLDEPYLKNYEKWINPFIDRFTSPWSKFFLLQVHLVSPFEIPEYIIRSVGSSITQELPDKPSPGFQVIQPINNVEALEWSGYLERLEIIHTNKSLQIPRLSELVSLEEAHAVFRLPYPPDSGLPNTIFINHE